MNIPIGPISFDRGKLLLPANNPPEINERTKQNENDKWNNIPSPPRALCTGGACRQNNRRRRACPAAACLSSFGGIFYFFYRRSGWKNRHPLPPVQLRQNPD